jgi:hypothetical protein
MINGLIVR